MNWIITYSFLSLFSNVAGDSISKNHQQKRYFLTNSEHVHPKSQGRVAMGGLGQTNAQSSRRLVLRGLDSAAADGQQPADQYH